MLIAFVGDVHGRVYHALAALATCQAELGRRFDFLVQVGDLGAFPDVERMDAPTQRYLEVDPSEADFANLLQPGGPRAENIRRVRERLGGPVHFVRGNHEDFDWLDGLSVDASKTAPVDAYDAFRYVPDGTVLEAAGLRFAFLGGAEGLPGKAGIDRATYDAVAALGPGAVDVLVTHHGPYGSNIGYSGDVQGSRMMAELLETLRPAFHVAGHAHQVVGPRVFGETSYVGLTSLIASALRQPDARGLQQGCIAVLDTDAGELRHVKEPWMAAFETPFDFDAWCSRFDPDS